LGDIDIGIVVNNAGTLSRGAYIEIDPAGLTRDIKVDLLAIFVINRFMVPRLRARAHRSAIINMASCTGVYLSHRIGVYSSGKKTVDIYSRILAIENKDKIDVLSARPFGVATRMMKMKKGPFMVTPRQCVVSIIADLLGGQTTTFSHL
jgi:short-subunit dehydrogenase